MSRRITGILLTTLVMIGGCSSDTQPEVEPPMTLSPTTLVPPPPTRAATTAPQTTTTTSTTTSTTTTTTTVALPPPTEVTIPEGDLTASEQADAEFRAAVENDWRKGRWLYDIALTDPTNPETASSALDYTAGVVNEKYAEYLDLLATSNQYGISNSEIPHKFTITDGPYQVDGQPDQATMTYCEIDATVILQRQSDGSTTVANNNIVRRYWSAHLRFDGSVWQVFSLEMTKQDSGITSCENS